MTQPRHVAVIDIGKTNAKLALVDLTTRREIAVERRTNRVRPGPPYAHFDTEGNWEFILRALATLRAEHGVDAISVTTHGACAALLAADGTLAAPVMDYEHRGPDDLAAAYDALRPPFSETGSPRLPMGLNLGAQIHWQLQNDPGLAARLAHVVTWPQYWGFRLTGQLASDVSSIGCHTDLWNPYQGRYSSLVDKLGLSGKFAPARKAGDILGTITAEVARATGLAPTTPVAVGIHDSNASLLPHLLDRQGPFSVVSTGTWVVCMAVEGDRVTLDPTRDTLVNVNAMGQATPSARYMGGREYELIKRRSLLGTYADYRWVFAKDIMLLPSVVHGSGPFPNNRLEWVGGEPGDDLDGPHTVALGFYLALMTAECLVMIGARGPVVVEGPFGRNRWFVKMLAAATGRPVVTSASQTGTAIGAALLFGGAGAGVTEDVATQPPESAEWAEYARKWQERARAARGAKVVTA